MSHKEKRLSLKKKVESAPAQHIEDDLHGDNSHVFITRDGHTKIVSKEEKARLEWQKKNHEIHDDTYPFVALTFASRSINKIIISVIPAVVA